MQHVAGKFYHVFNRGCNREPIFYSRDNYAHLLRLMHRFLEESVRVVAYCLMPNHYHFLLMTEKDGSVARFVQRTFNAYAQSLNRQLQRSGTVFEGRAKSILVDEERYAIYLCRYIHLNPVVAGMVPSPADWPYSNYLEWTGKRNGTLVDRRFVEEHCGSAEEYETFVMSSLEDVIAAKIAKYCAD